MVQLSTSFFVAAVVALQTVSVLGAAIPVGSDASLMPRAGKAAKIATTKVNDWRGRNAKEIDAKAAEQAKITKDSLYAQRGTQYKDLPGPSNSAALNKYLVDKKKPGFSSKGDALAAFQKADPKGAKAYIQKKIEQDNQYAKEGSSSKK